jgi:hypothetical protein
MYKEACKATTTDAMPEQQCPLRKADSFSTRSDYLSLLASAFA